MPGPSVAPSALPVNAHASAIVAAVRSGRPLVLSAPTGSGKTTQVPQILLRAATEAGIGDGRIVVLQPRRLATRMVAQRVAAELGVPLGGLVGFQTRHDSAVSAQTRVAFLTEGLFLRQMIASPSLSGVSCVVLDEFHERSVDADLILALVARLRASTRPDLRLVVMSATLDVEGLSRFLDVTPMGIEGRAFPVETRFMAKRSPLPVWDLAAEHVVAALDDPAADNGDVLVFMPGVYEIVKTLDAIRRKLPARIDVALRPLHGSLPPREQDAAVAPGAKQRVIVATNVAETSLTIPGVRTVIDSGMARIHRHDPLRGINTLRVEPISRASAEQRAGRAGRTAPGTCLRLWTPTDHAQRPERDLPEILRLELSEPMLHVLALDVGDPALLRWLDAPSPEAMSKAREALRRLDAIDENGRLTAIGRAMAEFPVHPRLSRFLVAAAERRCLGRAVVWAAVVGERDIVEAAAAKAPGRMLAWLRAGEPPSDVVARESALAGAASHQFDVGWCRSNGISPIAAREAWRTVEQLRTTARRRRMPLDDGTTRDLLVTLLPGFGDHIAVKLDLNRPHCAMDGRRRVVLAEESVVRQPGPIVALELREIARGGNADVALALATPLDESILAEAFPGAIATVAEDAWSEERRATERVERRVLRLPQWGVGELELSRVVHVGARAGDRASAADEIVERIVRGELKLSRWDEDVDQWIARVRLLARLVPERGLIAYDDDDRRVILHELVGRATRFGEVQDKPCLDAVRGALSWDDQRFVDAQAPTAIALPGGRRLRIEYFADGPPVGRAKIQELYDLVDTPRIASGRQLVLLEILGPNQRPVQRTTDLAGFWRTLYPELKKELKRRYPRHEWR